jgi:hypothetical protein
MILRRRPQQDRIARAEWQLEQAGYRLTVDDEQYRVTNASTGDTLLSSDSLDAIVAFANREYGKIWVMKRVPSA